MLTNIFLKNVQKPTYLVQVFAVILLFAGASILLWRISNSSYRETVLTFIAFFAWQAVTSFAVRFSPLARLEARDASAISTLIAKAVGEVAEMKHHGGVIKILVWSAGISVVYIVFRGLMIAAATAILSDIWMAGAIGAIFGAIVVAPWVVGDLKNTADQMLANVETKKEENQNNPLDI